MKKLRLKKISYLRVLVAAIVFAVVSYIVHFVGALIEMPYYLIEEYFPVWSKVMMPAAGPPPMSFHVYSILFGFVSALMFVLVYAFIKQGIPSRSRMSRGMVYGVLVFMLASIPSFLSMYLLINLPLMLLVSWTIQGLVIFLLGGIITAYIVK